MNPLRYAADRAAHMLIVVTAAALAFLVLTVAGVSWQVSVLTCCLFLLAGALMFALGYVRKRHFYRDLDEICNSITRSDGRERGTGASPLWAMELLDEPEYLDIRDACTQMELVKPCL